MKTTYWKIIKNLMLLVKPLLGVMELAILMGTVGSLFASFIPVLAGACLLEEMRKLTLEGSITGKMWIYGGSMVLLAVLRGFLRYGEQYCNHYIAFRLLALLRHRTFAQLRRIGPAKLAGKDRGDLMAMITHDIEALEVFFAHTLSPVAIAFLSSLGMLIFIGSYSLLAAGVALTVYLLLGVVLPCLRFRHLKKMGQEVQKRFSELNTCVLDSLYGVEDLIQYDQMDNQTKKLTSYENSLHEMKQALSDRSAKENAWVNSLVAVASVGIVAVMGLAYSQGQVEIEGLILVPLALMSSLGPCLALTQLPDYLTQTLASGERLLRLLDEHPAVKEGEHSLVTHAKAFTQLQVEKIDFSYEASSPILKDYSLNVFPHRIMGIHGSSGSGKSTLLKLFMRFYDVDKGKICLNTWNLKDLTFKSLRSAEAYMTQDTYVFKQTVWQNIALGHKNPERESVILAAKKAALHDTIQRLPEGYDTVLGVKGSELSAGEKQRLALARAFFSKAPILLLDEPTNHLDVLNEGMILKALKEISKERTILLVSHRISTLQIADEIYTLEPKA